LFESKFSTAWDYQWWLASWMNNGLHAWPNNGPLVSNVGFDSDATYTSEDKNLPFEFRNAVTMALDIVVHPKFIIPCREAYEFAFMHKRLGSSIVMSKKLAKLSKNPLFPLILMRQQLRREGVRGYLAKRALRLISFWLRLNRFNIYSKSITFNVCVFIL
jgi:hypothetical protein